MYRNQYEYDNAEPQGPSLREIAEERVVSLLDKRDPEMVEKMVGHAALWLDNDDVSPLLEALAMLPGRKFWTMVSAINETDPATADALCKLGQYADKARLEFIIEEAEEMLKEAAE